MRSEYKSIFIIGSGAIGKALAVFLKLSGRDVTLIRGSVDDGSNTTEILQVQTADGVIHESAVEIATAHSFDSIDGVVVVATKSYGNEQLSIKLRDITGTSPLVILQNGLGVERPFIDRDFPEVYRCVLFVTSQVVNNTTVRFKPVATCPVGVERGDTDSLNTVVDALNTPQFSFSSELNIQQLIWKKAIANCVFNSVCPLLEVDNGIFHRDEFAFGIARQVIAECVAIAKRKGVMVETKEVEDSLLQISKSSDGQLISTLQDIRHGRRTEIDTLNFEIVKLAQSLNIGHQVQKTQLLGELTKLKAGIHQQVSG